MDIFLLSGPVQTLSLVLWWNISWPSFSTEEVNRQLTDPTLRLLIKQKML